MVGAICHRSNTLHIIHLQTTRKTTLLEAHADARANGWCYAIDSCEVFPVTQSHIIQTRELFKVTKCKVASVLRAHIHQVDGHMRVCAFTYMLFACAKNHVNLTAIFPFVMCVVQESWGVHRRRFGPVGMRHHQSIRDAGDRPHGQIERWEIYAYECAPWPENTRQNEQTSWQDERGALW